MNQALAAAPAVESKSVDQALPAIGSAFGGGFFTGVYQIGGQRFALITAGANGQLEGKWNDSLAEVDGATHRADGLVNTKAMAEAGSQLAKQALGLVINGFSDWYIPARDELEMQYRAFKPSDDENYADGDDGINPSSLPVGEAYTDESPLQTTVENFREGGVDALPGDWHWSSTQHAVCPTNAWNQDFFDGSQNFLRKSYPGCARLVRRLPI